MKLLRTAALLGLLAASQIASALVVTFNTAPDNNYLSGPITSDGFIAAATGDNLQGTSSDFDANGQTNGTIYYGVWNNDNLPSTAFTLKAADNALFALTSFDFDNAYQTLAVSPFFTTQARTFALTLEGMKADNSLVTTTFSDLESVFNWTTLGLANNFTGLKSVSFTASGDPMTRALFDNFVVNADNAVPEPGTIALLGIALLSLGLSRKRR